MPRALRELSRTRFPQSTLELLVTQRYAQCLYIGVSSDIHDLRDESMTVPQRAFSGLPPNVFAGQECEVHDAILQRCTGRVPREYRGETPATGLTAPTTPKRRSR